MASKKNTTSLKFTVTAALLMGAASACTGEVVYINEVAPETDEPPTINEPVTKEKDAPEADDAVPVAAGQAHATPRGRAGVRWDAQLHDSLIAS